MSENEALKEIYYNLQLGKSYGKYDSYGFDAKLYLFTSRVTGKNLIGWRNYGSSANKNTLKDLKWIINTIFDTTAKEFINEFILN